MALGKCGRWAKDAPRWALGLGSVAPDLPLYVLSFGGIWYFGTYKQMPRQEVGEHIFHNLFYNDPIWLTLHNFLHSPTMLFMLVGACLVLGKWPTFRRGSLFFLASCSLHCLVDIATHNDDGPLLFFPFNWNFRFSSPVSYWDPDHHGVGFMVFEGILDLILVGVLVRCWLENRGSNEAKNFS